MKNTRSGGEGQQGKKMIGTRKVKEKSIRGGEVKKNR